MPRLIGRRPSPFLTDAELRIMRVLWGVGRASGAEIVDGMNAADAPIPAYNSVLTILRILERKGYVRHDKDGRAFTFEPIVDRNAARRSALTQVLAKFFDNSRELLALDLLGHEPMDADELARLRDFIASSAPTAASRKRGKKR